MKKRIVVAITGASGVIYGVTLLRALKQVGEIETHLVVSSAGYITLAAETDISRKELESLADVVHKDANIGASIASGSFPIDSMVIAPCSMKTLAAIANGLSTTLTSRAADVALKERRRLILLARETPLNLVHLRNMTAVTEAGAIVCPPVPAFYAMPETIEDIINHSVGRVLSLMNIETELGTTWHGLNQD